MSKITVATLEIIPALCRGVSLRDYSIELLARDVIGLLDTLKPSVQDTLYCRDNLHNPDVADLSNQPEFRPL